MLNALLWDVDGTLAETERDGHRVAFNRAFEAMGLPWRWDEKRYGELLRVAGGRERILHDMSMRQDAPASPDERQRLAASLHQIKNRAYAELVDAGDIRLRDGVRQIMEEARARGVLMGIATTTSRSNVEALLSRHLGRDWASWFDVVVCGEDTRAKKPDPEVYELALQGLGIGPLQAVAIEDSPGGVAAAQGADIPVLVTRSAFFANSTVEGAIAIGPGFHQRTGWAPSPEGLGEGLITLDDIAEWHSRMELVSGFG